MEYMPDFKVLKPVTVEEAIEAYGDHASARYLAGGTDLIVNVRRGIEQPDAMIDLSVVEELKRIEVSDNGDLVIGAGVTLGTLLQNDHLQGAYQAISEAASLVAAATHREVATIGGNLCLDTRCVFYNQSEWWRKSNDYCLKYRGEICHVAPSGSHCFAAFSGDLAPALIAFGAIVEIAGPEGRRNVRLADIYADEGDAHMLLDKGEILVSVRVPAAEDVSSGYLKVRVRDSVDFPLAGVAVSLTQEAGKVVSLRVALTGTNSCPLLLSGTDAVHGGQLDDEAIEKIVKLIPKQIQPMTSTFTPPGYRRKVIANLTRSLLSRLSGAS